METANTRCYIPPELARIERVKPEKIIAEIRAGRLDAHNVASVGSKRPRYRITPEAVEAWRRLRAAVPAPTTTTKKRTALVAPSRRWI